jgi:hypothetical protein
MCVVAQTDKTSIDISRLNERHVYGLLHQLQARNQVDSYPARLPLHLALFEVWWGARGFQPIAIVART